MGTGIIQVVPAYGRDYTSKQKVKADLVAGKDFRILDISQEHNGRYTSLSELKRLQYTQVRVRYSNSTKVVIFDVSDL
jgi:hypothetical protein